MDFSLSADDRRIQQAARAFAREKLAPLAREADERRRFDRSRVPLLGGAGLLGGPLPREYGGGAWTNVQWALAQMELGAVDSSWRGFCTVQTALCGLLLRDFASDAQKRELLPKLASGEWIFACALTEPEAGSDLAAIATRATRSGDGWSLEGTKIWITNGGVADCILVFATIDPALGRKGLTCFLVPGDAAGLERQPVDGVELGHRGADHAVLRFHGVRVPASAVVGGEGKGLEVALGGLEHGRLGVASGAVGIQLGCLDACLEFARSRRQFGQRIADFQQVQADLAEMHVALESTQLLTLHAAWLRDRGEPNLREVSTAKYAACEAAVRSSDRAVLLHGSRGYSSAFPVERFWRDAKGLQIYEGTAHIQRLIIARQLVGK